MPKLELDRDQLLWLERLIRYDDRGDYSVEEKITKAVVSALAEPETPKTVRCTSCGCALNMLASIEEGLCASCRIGR